MTTAFRLWVLLTVACGQLVLAGAVTVNSIYEDIRPNLYYSQAINAPSLELFLQSAEGRACIEKAQPLLAREKHRLMYRIYTADTSDTTWKARSNYIAAMVAAGGWVDLHLPSGSSEYGIRFLGEAVLHSDIDAVRFALQYKAKVAIKSFGSYPLALAKTFDIAQLLVQAGADVPIRAGGFLEQDDLLTHCMWAHTEPKVLQLHKDIGFDLAMILDGGGTLLHRLCGRAGTYSKDPEQLTHKFNIIMQSGVDVNAHDIQGRTALDVATAGVHYQPDNMARQHAQCLLQTIQDGCVGC